MSDDRPFYVPNSTKPAPRQPLPRELLFEFRVDGRWYRCELIDHGPHGVEAAFTQPERDYLYSRRFDTRMDPTRTPRALAVQWAEEERKATEKNGASRFTR
jgi:hypothetical protein